MQRWEDDEWENERQYSAGSLAEDDRNYAQASNQGGFSGDTWPRTSPIPGQPSAAAGTRAARRGPIDLDAVDDWD